MNNKQLSPEEVQKLFTFVESKYVRFEDLKYELVDHLGSSIEDLQSQDPTITFDQGLKETYSRFPITGFTNFVAEKQKALSRYWYRILFKHIIEYFKLPKIILLSAMSYFIWLFFQSLPHAHVLILIYTLIFISFILNGKRVFVNVKQAEKDLFLQSYNAIVLGNMYMVLNIPAHGLSFGLNSPPFMEISFNNYVTVGISIFISLSLIISHITLNVLPKVVKKEVNEKYAHLNINLA